MTAFSPAAMPHTMWSTVAISLGQDRGSVDAKLFVRWVDSSQGMHCDTQALPMHARSREVRISLATTHIAVPSDLMAILWTGSSSSSLPLRHKRVCILTVRWMCGQDTIHLLVSCILRTRFLIRFTELERSIFHPRIALHLLRSL